MRYKNTFLNPPTIIFFARSAALCALKFGVYKLSSNSDDWLDALFFWESDFFLYGIYQLNYYALISVSPRNI
jgi:hypothetical protein